MAGTLEGGLKAAETNRKKYGDDFYKLIGRKGGKISRGGGFSKADKDQLTEWGKKGGRNSWKHRT